MAGRFSEEVLSFIATVGGGAVINLWKVAAPTGVTKHQPSPPMRVIVIMRDAMHHDGEVSS
jgi:hypothetical protein